MAHAIRKPNDNSLLHEREDNTGSGGSLPLSPTLRRTLGGDARLPRARSPGRLRASQQESPSEVGIFPLTNRSATLRAALVTPPLPALDSR